LNFGEGGVLYRGAFGLPVGITGAAPLVEIKGEAVDERAPTHLFESTATAQPLHITTTTIYMDEVSGASNENLDAESVVNGEEYMEA
jgi:hypothetical protein